MKIHLNWTTATIQYSPSMREDLTVALNWSEYFKPKNDIFLPLANGLIYAGGRALVKNCSAWHTAVHWMENGFEFEESGLHFYANYQLLILDSGYEVGTCLSFANRVNTTPDIVLQEELSWPQ
jgi:hypothetical protein